MILPRLVEFFRQTLRGIFHRRRADPRLGRITISKSDRDTSDAAKRDVPRCIATLAAKSQHETQRLLSQTRTILIGMSACGESHPAGAATCLHADNASQQFCNQVDERIPRTRRRRTTAADAARPTTLHPFLPRSMPIAAIFLIYAVGVTESLRLASAEGAIRKD